LRAFFKFLFIAIPKTDRGLSNQFFLDALGYFAAGASLPPIFKQLPLGVSIKSLGPLSIFACPAQERLLALLLQPFCPALATPKHFSFSAAEAVPDSVTSASKPLTAVIISFVVDWMLSLSGSVRISVGLYLNFSLVV